MAFADNQATAFKELQKKFKETSFTKKSQKIHTDALRVFTHADSKTDIALSVDGTDFQHKVWRTLMSVPFGKTTTYGDLAKKIKQPQAQRAVGTAVGANPIALLIPCHRVIQASGATGKYHWGSTRKQKILDWEQTKNSQ